MFGGRTSQQPGAKRGSRWGRWLLGLGLAAGGATAVVQAQMQDAPGAIKLLPDKSFMNKNPFYLPVTLDERTRNNLQEIQLYCKEDANQPWVLKAKISPKQNYFNFKAPHDGEYWFTLVTVDKKGVASQLDDTPNLIVHLDTQAPQIGMSLLPECSDGKVVQVDVRDLNLDASKTQFLFQTGNKNWHRVEPMANTVNHYCIPRQAVLTGMVKVVAADLAGNSLVREFNMSSLPTGMSNMASNNHLGSTEVHPFPPAPRKSFEVGTQEVVVVEGNSVTKPESSPPAQIKFGPKESVSKASAPMSVEPEMTPHKAVNSASSKPGQDRKPSISTAEPARTTSTLRNPQLPELVKQGVQTASLEKQIMNHMHLFLEYQIDQTGPSGVGKVEIWLTKDMGQTWQRQGEVRDAKGPAEIDLPGEGVFGISLVASNGGGYGLTPPAPGDAPHWCVEVDLTRPTAEITGVRHAETDDNSFIITWNARDKNLGDGPIDLFFANDRKGPWHPIVKGQRNDGSYRWNVPGDVGSQAFIRLMVTDQAGNSTVCESTQAFQLDDLSRPRIRPVGITPTVPRTVQSPR